MKPLFILLILTPFLACSQGDKIKMSFIAGTGLSWMSSEAKDITTEKSNINYLLLLQGEYLLTEKFSLTSGVGFTSRQGGELQFAKGGNIWSESKLNVSKGDSLPNGVLLRYKASYLDIPIGFKMQTLPINKFRFFIHPDVSMGVRLGAKGDIEGLGIESSKENIKSQIFFFTFNWGLNFGGIYELDEKLGILMGFRFQQSLLDVTDDSGIYSDGTKIDYKDKISNLDFRIGVIF